MRRQNRVSIFGAVAFAFGCALSFLCCQSTQPVNECHSCSDAQVCCYFFIYRSFDSDSGQLVDPPDADPRVLTATCGTLIDSGPEFGALINGALDGASGECALVPPE